MMCELFHVVTCATAILICLHCVAGSSDASTISEKSEVVLKFITYAIKIPSNNRSTGQKNTNNKKLEFDQVNCSSQNVTKAMSDLQKKIKCIPRDAVVELAAPDGSNVDPQTVVVKRCGGMCFGRQKCISSKQMKTEFYVTTIQENSATIFCNRIQVYEDVECQCGCLTKEKDCTQRQIFNKDLCKCECSNKNNEMACRNQNQQNFYWNSNTCTCKCKSKKICTTGTVWMESQCNFQKGLIWYISANNKLAMMDGETSYLTNIIPATIKRVCEENVKYLITSTRYFDGRAGCIRSENSGIIYFKIMNSRYLT